MTLDNEKDIDKLHVRYRIHENVLEMRLSAETVGNKELSEWARQLEKR
jgi:hypothetical protein